MKLHGHEQDIRELYRYSARAYERISATTEVLANLRVDVKGVQEQIHSDHEAVLVALGEVKAAQATANGGWRMVKWGIPLVLATAGTVLAGLGLMYKSGLAG
jgi:CO dehydrogenase/acetyl-CoA synthase alpha subunit